MPFVLDAPISSTWHMARSWGLLTSEAVRRQAAPARAQAPVRPVSALAQPRDLIERTLRAVGLLGTD